MKKDVRLSTIGSGSIIDMAILTLALTLRLTLIQVGS